MFLTYTRSTGQLFQVVVAPDVEASHYESDEQGVFLPTEALPDDLSSYYVSEEGALTLIPSAPTEGVWLWDWETHAWKQVAQTVTPATTSEVQQ